MEPLPFVVAPKLYELEQRIKEIESIDLAVQTIDEIKDKLKLLFTGYTISSPIILPGRLIFP